MITLLYFARLRETFGISSEQIILSPTMANIGDLVSLLRQRGAPWKDELAPGKPVRLAVNQAMANSETPITDGDEIAIFPPVTGG
jgi:molybdopterin synthase sulfur carrier subunit